MHLSKEEERILAGEEGWARARALEVVVKVGEALGAERLQPIAHAHVSGVSYYNIGEPGRRFLEDLAASGAKVSVPTTANPIGFDLDSPQGLDVLDISPEYVRGQMAILNALKSMGIQTTLSCTPYYMPDVKRLRPGNSVAWGESNAVVYANSILGLRTNREGGPLALMAAIAGRTYYYGLHVPENRVPRVAYRPGQGMKLDEARIGVMGELISSMHRAEGPPMLEARLSEAQAKELGAAMGAAGDIAMVFLPGITPERPPKKVREVIEVEASDVERRLEELAPPAHVDIVYLGCPHASAEEVEELARLLRRGSPRPGGPRLIITMSREEEERLSAEALEVIRTFKGLVVRDTCLVVAPLRRQALSVATNSYKAYFYLSRRGLKVGLEPAERLAERLVSGV